MKIKVGFGRKRMFVDVTKVSPFESFGLMFRTRWTGNLLFDFKKEGKWAISAFFVFFSFLALWLDEKNNVLEYKIVKPFTFSVQPKNEFAKLIEIPLNNKNKNLISHFPSVYGKV
jgi:uncharacterized membrane protein (UPF0127 family)